jgi:serine/threonine protein kinase
MSPVLLSLRAGDYDFQNAPGISPFVLKCWRDCATGRHVAIKVLAKAHLRECDIQARFQNEIDTFQQLHHPNVVNRWLLFAAILAALSQLRSLGTVTVTFCPRASCPTHAIAQNCRTLQYSAADYGHPPRELRNPAVRWQT